MPTLLEVQSAMRRNVLYGDKAAIAAMLADGIPPDRLDIYRNTVIITLTRALLLSFPAVQKLVGEAFFEEAAQIFIGAHPPRVAWLDQYGAAFADFLRGFPPAQDVCYLADVAALEWAVSRALHAADAERLDPVRLASVEPEDQGRIRLIAEPSVTCLSAVYPVDDIWRAVLAGDDASLRAIDLESGEVHLLAERRAEAIEMTRLSRDEWRFLARLCAGDALEAAIDPDDGFDAASALAEHLSKGRFTDFELVASLPEARQ